MKHSKAAKHFALDAKLATINERNLTGLIVLLTGGLETQAAYFFISSKPISLLHTHTPPPQ